MKKRTKKKRANRIKKMRKGLLSNLRKAEHAYFEGSLSKSDLTKTITKLVDKEKRKHGRVVSHSGNAQNFRAK